jgi:hypothetical protein
MVGLLAVILLLSAAHPAVAQRTEPADRYPADHSPSGALWRAAALPGWGQAYNRQYYKIPVVWVGLGGISAATVYLQSEYRLFHRAYQFQAWEEVGQSGEENPAVAFEPEYERVRQRYGDIAAQPLRNHRDNLRRNRDLALFGLGLWYGLSILDAYVAAHLVDFDVGEDLTVSLRPAPGGLQTALVWRW